MVYWIVSGMVGCARVRSSRVGPLSSVGTLGAGQACGGRWALGLEHASVRLADVTVPGDGG